jgi:hypothetical protein
VSVTTALRLGTILCIGGSYRTRIPFVRLILLASSWLTVLVAPKATRICIGVDDDDEFTRQWVACHTAVSLSKNVASANDIFLSVVQPFHTEEQIEISCGHFGRSEPVGYRLNTFFEIRKGKRPAVSPCKLASQTKAEKMS